MIKFDRNRNHAPLSAYGVYNSSLHYILSVSDPEKSKTDDEHPSKYQYHESTIY